MHVILLNWADDKVQMTPGRQVAICAGLKGTLTGQGSE